METRPSEQATYASDRSYGVIASKHHVEVTPKYGGIFKANDVIRLEIPAMSWLNPAEFFITMQLQLFPGASNAYGQLPDSNLNKITPAIEAELVDWAGTFLRPVPGIQSFFSRVRVLAGSTAIEDITDYNVLYRMFLAMSTTQEYRESQGYLDEGIYDEADWETRMAVHNKHCNGNLVAYSFKPLLGLLQQDKYIPLKYMGVITLEFYLEQPSECLWSSVSVKRRLTTEQAEVEDFGRLALAATCEDTFPSNLMGDTHHNHMAVVDSSRLETDFPNAYYQLSNVRAHVSFVNAIDSYDRAVQEEIESSGVDIQFETFLSHTKNIATIGRHTIPFQERAISLKGAVGCFRSASDIRDIRSDLGIFPSHGISTYQWRLGSEYYPSQPVDCTQGGTAAHLNLRKALGTFGNVQSHSMIREYNFLPRIQVSHRDPQDINELRHGCSMPNNFFFGIDLEKSPGQQSGFDSVASAVDLEFMFELRDHASIVKGQSLWTSSNLNASWQPSKLKVHENFIPREPGPNGHYVYQGVEYRSDYLPAGVMIPKQAIVKIEFAIIQNGDQPGVREYSGHSHVLNQASEYARLYLFTHVDTTLRIRRVGQLEVIR